MSRADFYLHCCLFPGDFEFERETLVQLWMAMGFLGNLKEVNMEDVGNNYFEILLSEKYILPPRTDNLTGQKKYKVNLDKVNSISTGRPTKSTRKIDHSTSFEAENKEADGSMKICHVSVVANHINQTIFETLKKFSQLKTLLFIPDYGSSVRQVPSSFFSALECLQALDLSGTHMTELPSSIANARQLHYLDLSFTLIERLPESIDCLQKLQTLKLKGCKHLFGLPKGIKKLFSLRHLDFDVLGQLTSMPEGIGHLTELRTLSAFIVNVNEKGCNLGELKNMNNLSGSCCISGLENAFEKDSKEAALMDKRHLTHLQLRWNDFKLKFEGRNHNTLETIENLMPNSCLKELHFICYPGSKFPTWIADNEKFRKLTSIALHKCENVELNIPLGKLPQLKCLDITEMDRVTKIDRSFLTSDASYYAFPYLEKLTVDCMFSLESWTEVKDGDLPLLSELSIKNCPKLIAIPFLPLLCSLKHLEITNCTLLKSLPKRRLSSFLETLLIDDCPSLKESCSKGGNDWKKIKHVPNIWIDLEDAHSTHEDGAQGNISATDSLSDDDELGSTDLTMYKDYEADTRVLKYFPRKIMGDLTVPEFKTGTVDGPSPEFEKGLVSGSKLEKGMMYEQGTTDWSSPTVGQGTVDRAKFGGGEGRIGDKQQL